MQYTWLLWLAMSAAVCLPPIPSMPPFFALLISGSLVLAWVALNVSPKRLFYSTFMSIIEVFFREIGARNQFKVPHHVSTHTAHFAPLIYTECREPRPSARF